MSAAAPGSADADASEPFAADSVRPADAAAGRVDATATGSVDVAAARPAATVVLLRDRAAGAGIEVWLLRRVRALAFAPGASVFPGGRVDPGDHGPVAWAGADASESARRFGCCLEDARASTVAAVRETFEETGVLLTRPAYDVSAAPDPYWLQAQRRRVEGHELPFTAFLAELGVAVDADLIRAWARWITPAGEPRRYDTYFYVAARPRGAIAHPETSEASDAAWIAPSAALAEHERGARPMLPPTVVTLGELADFATVDDVLRASAGRSLAPIEPELIWDEHGGVSARLPDGRQFRLPRS